MAEEKKYLRAILKETRESLTPSCAAAFSARVQSAFLDADFYRQSQALILYAAIANEVSTDAILSDALAADRAIFYPRLDRTRNALSLCKVTSRSALVPGLAFSVQGERMGRGGGHYDRLIAELAEVSPQAVTVGLAYSFQLLDHIPQSGWDRRLNFVVTESAIYPAPDAIWRESGVRTQGGIPR